MHDPLKYRESAVSPRAAAPPLPPGRRRRWRLRAAGLLLALAGLAGPARGQEPQEISPPLVGRPIHDCARAVFVFGFAPGAEVKVYANAFELVGQDKPVFGFATIPLLRPLKVGDSITATQTIGTLTSLPSYSPVAVEPYRGALNPPVVGDELYQCGEIVPVDKLVPGVKAEVFGNGALIGWEFTATPWSPVVTRPLVTAEPVTARQVICADDPPRRRESPLSAAVAVRPEPSPLRRPRVDPSSVRVGGTSIDVHDLHVGASFRVFDNGVPVGEWLATASANRTPVSPAVQPGSRYTVIQKLCGPASPPSEPVPPTEEPLPAPTLLAPICAGSQYAVLRGTTINARVDLFKSGSRFGTAGAVNGDLVMALGAGARWGAGDTATAQQVLGPAVSPLSNTVVVTSRLAAPVIEILGGDPFFRAEAGETPIDGPVFPRGRGTGPEIRVQACCDVQVTAKILGVDGTDIADVPLTQVFPGYYSGRWDWSSRSGWPIPGGIPVGAYTLRVTSRCQEQVAAESRFYVIFDPAEVGGPARFSFDETAVWFGPGVNETYGLFYHLHPDDARVFGKAIAAARGATGTQAAAEKVARAEEALFAYSLKYHTNDVLEMLSSFTEAQCADDAAVLSAMLRAIGIPAHPATGDADQETGAARWNFDTWVEYAVGGGNWLILHPHEFPGMASETRAAFGTRGVASKRENDLVMMAGETWSPAEIGDGNPDVTFDRSACGEPLENHTSKAAWLVDLCEAGYWNPNHWDCATRRLAAGLRLEVDRGRTKPPAWGKPWVLPLTLSASDKAVPEGKLITELIADRRESKVFPDRVLATDRRALRLPAGKAAPVTVRLAIPETVEAGLDLYWRTRLGDEVLALQPVPLAPELAVELDVTGERRVGGELTATARLSGRSAGPLPGVELTLGLPPGVEVVGEPARRKLGSLAGNASREVTWKLRLTAPLPAGRIEVTAAARRGGWARASQLLIVPAGTIGAIGDTGENDIPVSVAAKR